MFSVRKSVPREADWIFSMPHCIPHFRESSIDPNLSSEHKGFACTERSKFEFCASTVLRLLLRVVKAW